MSNPSFEMGSGFRVCGYVVRKWVAEAKTYASLTVDVPLREGPRIQRGKHDREATWQGLQGMQPTRLP